MFGGGSLQLARVLGIRIGVNASWFLVLFIVLFWLSGTFARVLGDSTRGYVAAVLAAALFFGSIVLHELGHALAARREGIGVTGIDLFFFGGVMKMSSDTRTPGAEFRVAAAGPAVTLVIVGLSALLGIALAGSWQAFLDAARLSGSGVSMAILLASFLVSMNVALLGFNLIPAYPLDGGRIARAIAWRVTGDRGRATRLSARLGQVFAWCLAGYGLYLVAVRDDVSGGIWLLLLGWLLGGAARAALLQTAVTDRLEGVTVADVMDAEPVTIPASITVGEAYETYFLRYQGWPWFAVVDADGRYAGLAHRAAVEQATHAGAGHIVMRDLAAAHDPSDLVREDEPLEALLGSEPLRRLGALMAVDREGRLRGVVTAEQVARALVTSPEGLRLR
jgi:Zn-dependent protease